MNTSWAMMGLMAVKCSNRAALERGVKLLVSRQLGDGDWPEKILKAYSTSPVQSYTLHTKHISTLDSIEMDKLLK